MRGHVRKRGKGSWAIVLDLGRDANGKRKQKWITVRGSEKDAERELARLLHEMNTGQFVEPSKMTVAEYLRHWLEAYAKVNVRAKTFERYAEIVEKALIPALGCHRLAKLQPLHIQTFYSKALLEGRRDGRGGLSPQTVLHYHRVLREALQQAVRWQLLVRNPTDAVEPPRVQRQEVQVLDEKQTAYLLRACEGSWLYMPVLLAVTTGMRRGEILALRWRDVDLKAGTATVRQSLEQTNNGLAFKQPKTQKGRRVVVLPALAVDALRRHRIAQAKERLLMGPDYQDHDLICAQPDGRPLNPDSVSAAFRDFMGKLPLPRIRFHDLRHSHASHLLRQGVHPKVVSERLGHSTTTITLDLYSHLLPGLQEEAARRIDAALRAASQGTTAQE